MVFCNIIKDHVKDDIYNVTILILIDGFLQLQETSYYDDYINVTILILIDGFLQSVCLKVP